MNESASDGSPHTTGMQQKTDSPSSPTVADRTRLIATCMEPNGRVLRGVQGTLYGTPQRASLIIAKSDRATPRMMMKHATATATLCAAPSSARSGTFLPNENACTRQSRGLHTWRSTAVGPLQGFTVQYEAGCDVHRACRAWAGDSVPCRTMTKPPARSSEPFLPAQDSTTGVATYACLWANLAAASHHIKLGF